MTDNLIELNDDEINVEEIMMKIRESIRLRQKSGELPNEPLSPVIGSAYAGNIADYDESVRQDLISLESNRDIRNSNYIIKSHRPYIGAFLTKGRQLVHNEVQRYVDPVFLRQNEFNESTVRILNETIKKYVGLEYLSSLQQQEFAETEKEFFNRQNNFEKTTTDLSLKIEKIDTDLSLKIEKIDTDLSLKIEKTTTDLNLEIDQKIEVTKHDLISMLNLEINSQADLAHALKERITTSLPQIHPVPGNKYQDITNYFLFEERFRGSREEIKKKQMNFLPYFKNCSQVLDIGCGRGEFLEILKENNIYGTGVDIDTDMVSYCRSRQLNVVCEDAISYLENLNDKSLDGIFIDQVVEHLEPDYLVKMLALCCQKLKFGYYIVIETVNPLSFVSFANFFIDLTHKRPVHPETLQFLVNLAGFRECEKLFLSPVSDENRLKTIAYFPDMDEHLKSIIDSNNHNINILNSILLGAQDYAVIGKK